MNPVQILSSLSRRDLPTMPDSVFAAYLAAIQTVSKNCMIAANDGKREYPIAALQFSGVGYSRGAVTMLANFLVKQLNFLGVTKENTRYEFINDNGKDYLTIILSW